jgi:hypothetical protein
MKRRFTVRVSKPAVETWMKHTMAVVRAAVEWQNAHDNKADDFAELRRLLFAARRYRAWVKGRLDPAKRKGKR